MQFHLYKFSQNYSDGKQINATGYRGWELEDECDYKRILRETLW